MSDVAELKDAVENAISSYEAKIQNISPLFDTTSLLLSDAQEAILDSKEERGNINAQLRDILAKNEHLRKKDFDNMINGILQAQDQLEKEIRTLLRNYFNDQKSMAQELRENLDKFKNALARGETKRLKEFQLSIKGILARQDERKTQVVSSLKEFQKEQVEITEKFKELLAKGRQLRIKDLREMLNDFKAQREKRLLHQKKRKEEVAQMLDSFKEARKKSRFLPRAIDIDDNKKCVKK